MNRRAFFRLLAGLPLVGAVVAKLPTRIVGLGRGAPPPSNETFFVGQFTARNFINDDTTWFLPKQNRPRDLYESGPRRTRHFDTIAEAVEAAGPNTSIIVAPGHTETTARGIEIGSISTKPAEVDPGAWRRLYGSSE